MKGVLVNISIFCGCWMPSVWEILHQETTLWFKKIIVSPELSLIYCAHMYLKAQPLLYPGTFKQWTYMLQACIRQGQGGCEVDGRIPSLADCLGFTPSSDAGYLCDVGKVHQPSCTHEQGKRKGAHNHRTDLIGLFSGFNELMHIRCVGEHTTHTYDAERMRTGRNGSRGTQVSIYTTCFWFPVSLWV